ncbi:MAG TPA: hypothetical protein VLF62_00295 [Candidatus Saccharimonadales bacterium]|nr:hypothetical protein [Candidatus Saccharimonadales bacterium]
MFEVSETTATRLAKFETGLEMAGRMIAGVALVASMAEVTSHADELCVAAKGAAAIAVLETTGDLPSWTPPEYNPISATDGSAAMNALLYGSNTAPQAPSTC